LHARRNETAKALVIEACLLVQERRAKFTDVEALAALCTARITPIDTNYPDCTSHFQIA
jgi:hypothetical protein